LLSIEKQILHLLSRTDAVQAKELIRIYEGRNVAPQIVRNSLARLKKDGYAVLNSRSLYAITDQGKAYIVSIHQKPRNYGRQWDQTWYFVVFEIPETERKKRDGFRGDLIQLGFGNLINGVYISPWEYTKEVLHLGDIHQVAPYLALTNGQYLYNEVTSEQAWEIWRLDAVQSLYLEKWHWFRSDFFPSVQTLIGSNPEDPLLVFLRFLELEDAIAELGFRDPMLPKALLPSDWRGEEIITQLNECLRWVAGHIPVESMYHAFVTNRND
jgi:phenylacetic acid degradation operon negative regulatory protein